MITDEERREVAQELRKLTAPGCIRYAEEFYEELREIVALDLDGSFEGVANSLADFIDRPTCHNASGGDYMFKCSACGAEFEPVAANGNEYGDIFYTPLKPRYCSVCGARVVEKEEDDD